MYQNKKAYEVVLAGGDTEIVEANEVQETATRVKFLGHVPGHSDGSFNNEVVKSYRDMDVESYRLVPVAEENAKAKGQHLYRMNLTDGTSKTVRGDYVSHSPGGEGKAGRYIVATKQKNSNTGRTEYVVSDNRVVDVERVTEEQAAVPDQVNSDEF
jgi:hypothetical protein